MKPVKEIVTGIPKVDEALAAIYDTLGSLLDLDILNGGFVDVEFTGSALTQRVVHKLGRKYRGYIVVKSTGGGVSVLVDNVSSTNPKFEFDLTSSAPAVLRLWVY